MSRTIKAIYEDGVLKPLEPLHLAEHAETYVTVQEEPSRAAQDEGAVQTLADFPEYTGPLPRPFYSVACGE
ncbi:MAG: antitoxin family protein, partial [Bdellovibrionota bacterium]